jgi:hypothetical protein
MAPTQNDPYRIIKTYTNPNAGTGEGRRYVTANGDVWEEKIMCPDHGTGVCRGEVHKDRIVPL